MGITLRMIWARFCLDVVRVLIWPVVLIIFRHQFVELLSRITKLTAGGVSVSFQEEAEALANKVELAIQETLPPVGTNMGETNESGESGGDAIRSRGPLVTKLGKVEFQKLLERDFSEEGFSLTGRVIRTWALLEQEVAGLSENLGIKPMGPRRMTNVPRVVDVLVDRGYLAPEWSGIAKELMLMRNQFAHNPDMASVGAADSLMNSMVDLLNILTLMRGVLPAKD